MELVVVAPEALRVEIVRLGLEKNILFVPTRWGSRGTSRNQGFARASGKWIYFLDQDTRLVESALFGFAQELEGFRRLAPNVLVVGGRYLDGGTTTFWGRRYNWLANLWLENPSAGVRFLAGNAAFRRASFVAENGALYDETLEQGGEEIELCSRILARGGRSAVIEGLAVEHLASHSLRALWSRLRSHFAFKRVGRLRSSGSRPTGRAIRVCLLAPSQWSGIFVYLLALLLPRSIGERT